MKYELINPPNNKYTTKQQIFINRGFKENDLIHYMNLSNEDINDPEVFGEEVMAAAASELKRAIETKTDICVIVDSDCDGFSSSAILINYIYDISPKYIEEGHLH